MLKCGSAWRPVRIQRVVETFPTSTKVVSVVTDQGHAFLKGMGNPAGLDSLACELVAGELAAFIGIRTPDFAIVDTRDLDIPLHGGGYLTPGPAFVSSRLPGNPGVPGDLFLKRLRNKQFVAALVIFDTWIMNFDRCPPEGALDPEPNYDNLFFTPDKRMLELVALDHSHCFVEGTLDDDLTGVRPDDPRLFGCFPEFSPYLTERHIQPFIRRLADLDRGLVDRIIGSIPPQWGVTSFTRSAWVELIVSRAEYLSQNAPEIMGLHPRLAI